jgi:hypothetical protein
LIALLSSQPAQLDQRQLKLLALMFFLLKVNLLHCCELIQGGHECQLFLKLLDQEVVQAVDQDRDYDDLP